MRNLITNWKTTSAGLLIMAGAVVHLVFIVKAGKADEGAWMTAIVAVVTGIGLMVAGDGAQSVQAHEETKAALADIQNQIARVKSETSQVTKTAAGDPAKP